jgi:uncharacterized protein
MLLVKTYLDKSKVHGLGVFAGEPIAKGTKIWRFVEGFDQFFTMKQFAKLPKQAREFLQWHGFRWEDEVLFSADYDSHMNHSEKPNTVLKNGFAIASRNIRKGEEITNDYREFGPGFCASFLTKKPR